MGVKHAREYAVIIDDMVRGIGQVNNVYEFFDMTEGEWLELELPEQEECLKTLADDIFYGLGSEPVMNVGDGVIRHDGDNHVIRVHDGDNLISVIYLI
ncbi:hypothetical protein [Paenibacillus eucommiae]|uniref:Uncharacterized protein n=1 Tax=Paenibacillus eucommiae TaxID=1355755 RepID=A0ABS4J4U2_9BACL|nr:hypothetical protein [Paenibacillus eucommiae]MBP1994848.1 hypothetical protein [Paenibacillus eucommiae]